MYNYFMLIGRLTKDPELREYADGKRVVNIRLAVSRGFKNSNGEIETDFYQISFWEFLVDFIVDNIKKGMPVFVKGRLQTHSEELANGYTLSYPILIGEKLLFFPSGSDKTETLPTEEKE